MCDQKEQRVLVMYDVRGIQEYIFRTTKVKDAIGASDIIEGIIDKALRYAVDIIKSKKDEISTDLLWYDRNGVRQYDSKKEADVQVLYIGGGNAFCTYKNQELCKEINKQMSRFIIQKTYSLQLAIAITDETGDYAEDYKNVFEKMTQVKENMIVSRLIGAFPVMKIDPKTGYAIRKEKTETEGVTQEVLEKREREKVVRRKMDQDEKIFDNYVTEKGLDSTLAIVHIDGNNMGMRIRAQVDGIRDYQDAVMKMRRISYRINHSYKKVFENMKTYFDTTSKKQSVLKILVAGDDITYVCNGKIAIHTVDYYAKEISRYTLDGEIHDCSTNGEEYPVAKESDAEKLQKMGFSICAGIAYIYSHFPFYAGYEVAEACCETAKEKAKEERYMGYSDPGTNKNRNRVGNWVDFQICKNIQVHNLKQTRKNEYVTSLGENLLIRPYCIHTEVDFGMEKLVPVENTLENFKDNMEYFLNHTKNMPRSFAKNLRNTYPQGEMQMKLLYAFLESRGWKFPDNSGELYWEKDGEKVAKWYDALELMDYYQMIEANQEAEQEGEKNE